MAVRSYARPSRSRSASRVPVKLILGGVLAVLLLPVVFSTFGLLETGKSTPPTSAAAQEASYPPQLAAGESFAPTTDGAVAMATRFEKDYLTADLRDEATARPALEALASDSFAPQLSRLLDELYARIEGNPLLTAQQEGTPNVARVWPVTYKLERVDAGRVHVVIWAATLAGIKDIAAPRISWTRDRVKLVKVAGNWRVDNYQALTPIVPQVSRELTPTRDPQFYAAQEDAKEYDLAP